MMRTVVIDCFPESVATNRTADAIVAVDVIRATTTLVTAASLGWRCFPVPSLATAWALAARLANPLLVGEVGGDMPDHFDLTNSPAALNDRVDRGRPLILLSSSGTRLICGADTGQAMYVACLRNYHAQIAHLIANHPTVAVIGAGSRSEFRSEDQLGCAWIAGGLIDAGYAPGNRRTAAIVERWRDVPVAAVAGGASAEYLRRTAQCRDLDFILAHVADLDEVYRFEEGQIVGVGAACSVRRAGKAGSVA